MRRLASPVVVLLAVGLAAAAQGPLPAQKPEVVIPVGTEVVRVDVIVTDKGGKARPGLRREDFEIVEDGQPQTVTQFEAFAAPAAPSTGPEPLPSAVPAAAETAPPAPRPVPRRFIVLAVDDIHIEAANLIRLKKTLDGFLESEVAPEDMVALVTTSGRVSQELTDDRHTMRQVVAKLSLQGRRPKDFEVPHITDYQAELIERGDPEALMVAVMEIQARRPMPNPEAQAKAVARMVLHESINDARATFETVHTALTSLEPLRALPVSMSADFVSTGVTHVVVSGHVDLRDVPFVRTADRRLATVDIAGAVFDESGAVVGSLAIERAALDLTEAKYKSALAKGLPYQRAAPLKPGRYRVSIAVREGSWGKLGSATQWVEIPDLGQGALTLSSLFLKKEDAPVSAKRASASAAPSLREVQAHRVYAQDESLYAQFFVYNLEKHAEELVTQTEIWRGGNLLAASPPQPLESQAGAASGAPYTRKIKLRPFGPGDYDVRIVVKAAGADASASQRAGFRIE